MGGVSHQVQKLFARNERMVCVLNSPSEPFGPVLGLGAAENSMATVRSNGSACQAYETEMEQFLLPLYVV